MSARSRFASTVNLAISATTSFNSSRVSIFFRFIVSPVLLTPLTLLTNDQ